MNKQTVFVFVIGAIFVGTIGIGGYMLQREMNWKFQYESKAIELVCSMVKPEHLIDASIC